MRHQLELMPRRLLLFLARAPTILIITRWPWLLILKRGVFLFFFPALKINILFDYYCLHARNFMLFTVFEFLLKIISLSKIIAIVIRQLLSVSENYPFNCCCACRKWTKNWNPLKIFSNGKYLVNFRKFLEKN